MSLPNHKKQKTTKKKTKTAWQTSSSVSPGIPRYDASMDDHCPLTRTRELQRQERKHRRLNTLHLNTTSSSKDDVLVFPAPDDHHRSSGKLSTSSASSASSSSISMLSLPRSTTTTSEDIKQRSSSQGRVR